MGGGTFCSGAPQLAQQSWGRSWTRSQWPRAGQPGFKHCTVEPGRYCIAPLSFRQRNRPATEMFRPNRGTGEPEPQKPRGLCAGASSVSRKLYTTSSGRVLRTKTAVRSVASVQKEAEIYWDLFLLSPLAPLLPAFNFACSSAIFCWAAIISCCFASI